MTDLRNQPLLFVESKPDFRHYTELPNSSPLVIIDLSLAIVYCNDAFKSTFKLDIGDNIIQMHSNMEFIYLVKGFHESKYKNISVDINLTLDKENVVKGYFIRIERVIVNNTQYFVLSIQSLDQQKKLENKITSLHNALDHGKLPLMILDEAQKVTYVSKSFEDVLAKEAENIFGKNIIEILKNALDARDLEDLTGCLNAPVPWKKIINFHWLFPEEYWELHLNPIFDIERNAVSFIFIATNLTEVINQTRAIERSEKKQKLIIENISDLLLIVERIGPTFLFENANDNFFRTFHLDRNKISSLRIDDLLPKQLTSDIHDSIQKYTVNSTAVDEFPYKHDDDRVYKCKITSIPEYEKPSSYFIIGMKDITEEIQYGEQLKKAYHKEIQLNKMKSDFLANMSHEIRTPYNAILGYSEIINESVETGDIDSIKELMDSMKEVLGRALNLFTNIIDVSQIESGEVELEKVDLNCNQVIRNVSGKMMSDAAKKNLNFVVDIAADDCMIEVDWVKFEKIVQALVDNAIKYTNHGHIIVGTKSSNGFVEITIADTGVGIDQTQLERLIKPFAQEIEGYTRPFEGAGLGLTIAYKLTRLMNGNFEIESEKNKGTKIKLTFQSSHKNG